MTNTGIEWVAAVVAPWTVSIHPNFSGPIVNEATRLALLVERRQFEREQDSDTSSEPSLESANIVDLIEMSLSSETQVDATLRLWSLAADATLSYGERVASAAFAALGSLELDEPELAADNLSALAESGKEALRATSPYTGSVDLLLAYLLLLVCARRQDAQQFELARAACAECLEILRGHDLGLLETFSVSEGISWDSAVVQADMRETLFRRALGEWAHLQFMRDNSWTDAVRSRATWIDYRVENVFEERDARVLLEQWEERFESNSGKVVMGRTPLSEFAYSGYLIAELSGSTSLMSRAREALGKLRLLSSEKGIFEAREAIRLLRQAGRTGPLQTALRFIQSEGPSDALYREAKTVVDRSPAISRVTEADLLVLDFAADLLGQDELLQAIPIAERSIDSERLNGPAGWSALDRMWRTLRRLVPGSGADDYVAKKALGSLTEGVDEPVASAIALTLESLEWSAVDEEVRAAWSDWYDAHPDGPSALREVLAECLGLQNARGLSNVVDVARMVDDRRNEPTADDLWQAQNIIVGALQTETNAAVAGQYSFGGVDTGDVAVAFAMRFESADVWQEVTAMLLANVDAVLKAKALERIANFAAQVPEPVREEFAAGWSAISGSPYRVSMARSRVREGFPAALRAGASLGIDGGSSVIDQLLRWSSGDEGSRIETAKSVPYAISGAADSTWGHYLLLQLSYDRSPDVRAEAGQAMVRVSAMSPDAPQELTRRLEELLTSDGVRVPLRIIHAIQRVGLKGGIVSLNESLHAIADGETPRVLCRAARYAFELEAERAGED